MRAKGRLTRRLFRVRTSSTSTPTEIAIWTMAQNPSVPLPMFSTISSMGRKARSWPIRMATAILPVRARSCPVSSSILMATAVLDSAITNPSRIDCAVVKPRKMEHRKIAARLPATCRATALSAIFQVTMKMRTLSSVPIRNNSRRTPSSASPPICSRFSTTPNALGPSSTPAMIYPTSAGCFSRAISMPHSSAASPTTAMPVRFMCASIEAAT